MAKSPTQPQQGGSTSQPQHGGSTSQPQQQQQQGDAPANSPQQGRKPIFRDWASI